MKKIANIMCGAATIMILSGAGWGTPEANVSGDKKHDTNFFGTLETWSSPGRLLKIENISVDHLIEQIPMFLKPTLPLAVKKRKSVKDAALQAAIAAREAAIAAQKASGANVSIAKAAIEAAKAARKAADAAAAAANALASETPSSKKINPGEHILKNNPREKEIMTKIDLKEASELRVPHPNEVWIYQKEKRHRKYRYIEIIVISKDPKKTKTKYLIEKNKKIYCDRVIAGGPEEQEVPLEAIKSLKIKGYKDRKLEEIRRKQKKMRQMIRELKKKNN